MTGSGPHVPSETSRQTTYGLQTWQQGLSAQRGIRAPSKFGHDPCPVKRGHVAAVKCCVRKTRFFRCPGRGFGTQQEKPEPSVGLNTAKGKPVLFFCFPIPYNCRPHRRGVRNISGTRNPHRAESPPKDFIRLYILSTRGGVSYCPLYRQTHCQRATRGRLR